MLQLQSAFGVFALLAIAWAFGENRRAVSLRQAAIGLFVTILTAVALIKLPFVARALRRHQRRGRRDFVRPRAPAPPSCSAISAAARCRSI